MRLLSFTDHRIVATPGSHRNKHIQPAAFSSKRNGYKTKRMTWEHSVDRPRSPPCCEHLREICARKEMGPPTKLIIMQYHRNETNLLSSQISTFPHSSLKLRKEAKTAITVIRPILRRHPRSHQFTITTQQWLEHQAAYQTTRSTSTASSANPHYHPLP